MLLGSAVVLFCIIVSVIFDFWKYLATPFRCWLMTVTVICIKRSMAMKMACQQCFKFSTSLAGSQTNHRLHYWACFVINSASLRFVSNRLSNCALFVHVKMCSFAACLLTVCSRSFVISLQFSWQKLTSPLCIKWANWLCGCLD